jgi:hypothetical protein
LTASALEIDGRLVSQERKMTSRSSQNCNKSQNSCHYSRLGGKSGPKWHQNPYLNLSSQAELQRAQLFYGGKRLIADPLEAQISQQWLVTLSRLFGWEGQRQATYRLESRL